MIIKTLRTQHSLALILTLVIAGSASAAHGKLEPVPPGRMYKGRYVDIRAPDSKGWYLIGSSGVSMEFARKGKEQGERYGAQVLIFPLPPAKTKEEFLRLVKERFKAHSQRFSILKSEYRYSDKRSYPCVHISVVVENKKFQTAMNSHKKPVVQFISLYCRHPVRQRTGFAIIFSHRGTSLDPDLDTEAQSFADGVQVPGH